LLKIDSFNTRYGSFQGFRVSGFQAPDRDR